MNKADKSTVVAELTETFKTNSFVYLTDTTGLTANQTNKLRRMLFERGVEMRMVKNTLLRIAMEQSGKDFGDLKGILKGTTCVMTAEFQKVPAESINDFRATSPNVLLKGAWIDSAVFIGDDQLAALIKLKSREELIGEIIGLLQSPIKNVIGALQANGPQKIGGLIKALEERN
ncbi:50S ribosomal protein L10 [Bacteroidota bacterium]|nr:50S ribosomal protein L10 [Flavobacteriaceae bacterium]PHX77910.1 MAG: 50S ribosomal protein L10 [Flavobacteriales bacterium]GDX49876.1 50S ribosomal protein L10 [Bacteroidota bacterium]